MADISTVKLPNNSSYSIKDSVARADVSALQSGKADASTHNISTYTSVSQIGLTAGSATISGAWTALPDDSVLICEATDFSSSQVPTTSASVELAKQGTSYGWLFCHGKDGTDYRMGLNSSDQPTETWQTITPENIKIRYGQAVTGSNGTAAVTFSGFSGIPRIVCSAQGTSTTTVFDARPSNISTTGFTVVCTRHSGSTTSVASTIAVNWIAIGT